MSSLRSAAPNAEKPAKKVSAATRDKIAQAWANDPVRRQKYKERLRKDGIVIHGWRHHPEAVCGFDPDFDERF